MYMCLGNLSIIIYWRINIRLTPLKKMTKNNARTQDSLNHGQDMCFGVCIECK